ncbi:uncharacterized protein PHALS_04691 [Plasmopara halstedii]|uniref:Uncharacterized protein n=1 Tax=Plasmopara halstedii TaxID=4781 RepID=A0A0P1AA53_PLAHL|nr:uncharacterized protein PHALS_04691 [Plasmopara halstedii]CEG37250.1 hypothetical protein PHALS_04691 [Plasmopara halstedii]|eukprot:XP_024573619.1 hypothetical protein PHALS_04691 [Plasmopara halstedii]
MSGMSDPASKSESIHLCDRAHEPEHTVGQHVLPVPLSARWHCSVVVRKYNLLGFARLRSHKVNNKRMIPTSAPSNFCLITYRSHRSQEIDYCPITMTSRTTF